MDLHGAGLDLSCESEKAIWPIRNLQVNGAAQHGTRPHLRDVRNPLIFRI
jgi:hypothetical protein